MENCLNRKDLFMKRKKNTNTNEKIKCIVEVKEKIPDTTYSIAFNINIDILLHKIQNYISKYLNNNEKLKLNDFFKKEKGTIILIINRYADMCTSSLFPNELEQLELFKNASKQSLQYCYSNREKREKKTLKMLQNEGIENYINRAKRESLIDDDLIQKHFNTWNSDEFLNEETRNFYTYLDIYSNVEAERKFYLYFLPKIYEKAITDKVGNNLETYIFSKVKENLKVEIADLFYEHLEKLNKEE